MNKNIKKPNALLAALNRAVPKNDEPIDMIEHHNESLSTETSFKSNKKQSLSRVGKKLVAGHFEPQIARQLRILAAQEDTTVQSLLEEALNLLFVKKGKSHIKNLPKN